jgi:hypothetical protein
MSNQELIKKCRECLTQEDEPAAMEWVDMVETLCNALERAEQEIEILKNVYEND